MIAEKFNPIERALIAAAQMAPSQSRQIIKLICESGMTMTKPVESKVSVEGAAHYEKRRKFIDRMKSATDRVIDYAKHETLRNVEKHFRDNPGIASSEGDQPDSLAKRLTFDPAQTADELPHALKEVQLAALTSAGQGLFDEVGNDNPFKLTDKQALNFVKQRENLLSNVPDEIHQTIMQTIQQGLEAGDGRRQLMQRISAAFDEIGKSRAETIANTETAAAFNYAREKAMRKAGVTHKKWLHSQSPIIKEPRPTPVEADGQVRPIDEPFDIGGVPMQRPGDESAGPEEIINCHCVAIPVEEPK